MLRARTKAIAFPPGAQSGAEAFDSNRRLCRPPARIVLIDPWFEYAISLPSGDQDGSDPCASRLRPLPFGLTRRMLRVPEGLRRVYAIHLLSGDHTGWPARRVCRIRCLFLPSPSVTTRAPPREKTIFRCLGDQAGSASKVCSYVSWCGLSAPLGLMRKMLESPPLTSSKTIRLAAWAVPTAAAGPRAANPSPTSSVALP